jgi:hypothetical protein
MHMLAVILAQGAAEIAANPAALYVYGPLGIITGFFMLVSMKLISLGAKLVSAIKEDGVELRKEFKSFTHRMAGLERAMWADMVERESTGMHTKAYARRAIAKIDAQLGDTPS